MAQRVTIWDTVVKESGEFQRARAGGEEASLLGPLMELRGGRQQKQQDKQRDRLPVIVCPSELEFYLDQQESHKQVLTIYNINDFTLHFVLQSNAPRRYAVPEPEGVIYAHCFVDVSPPPRRQCGGGPRCWRWCLPASRWASVQSCHHQGWRGWWLPGGAGSSPGVPGGPGASTGRQLRQQQWQQPAPAAAQPPAEARRCLRARAGDHAPPSPVRGGCWEDVGSPHVTTVQCSSSCPSLAF
ncbi:uncharacterized protein LOC144150983 isoform X2 [Haemaphysalis longicornis]